MVFLLQPETIPQARIDMTRVLEVAAAEDITGHPYSLAITSPEGVTFVKGTCREETKWWADVLQVYARNKVRLKIIVGGLLTLTSSGMSPLCILLLSGCLPCCYATPRGHSHFLSGPNNV
ncbi:hypothetical protein QLX08_000040 [Tetragonisca angustula]|uniref:Protein outspread n=1 Tax=Tetragonisca angustula TaxID=166442 RepID=A0AAW1AN41_9HYME